MRHKQVMSAAGAALRVHQPPAGAETGSAMHVQKDASLCQTEGVLCWKVIAACGCGAYAGLLASEPYKRTVLTSRSHYLTCGSAQLDRLPQLVPHGDDVLGGCGFATPWPAGQDQDWRRRSPQNGRLLPLGQHLPICRSDGGASAGDHCS